MSKYIDKETVRRIIDSERSKEQMLTMLDNVPTADVLDMNVGDMVSRTAVIKIFSQLWDCIEEIADKEEWEDVCKTTANELPSAQQWIPCSEGSPSGYGLDWVLAQIQEDSGHLWIPQVMEYIKAKDDWYSNNEYLGWLKDHNGAFKVVAWMPLPEPYKAESEDME